MMFGAGVFGAGVFGAGAIKSTQRTQGLGSDLPKC